MKKKRRGFTLIELIIVLALMTLVLAVVSNFFINNNKFFKRAQVKSNLQEEASEIESLLMNLLLQSEGIEEVDDITYKPYKDIFNGKYKDSFADYKDWDGKIAVEKLIIRSLNKEFFISFEKEDNNLIVSKLDKEKKEIEDSNYPKVISENIEEVIIRPIDFRMNENGNLYKTSALEITIRLKYNKNKMDLETEVSMIGKFRNKEGKEGEHE